ncbi:TetR/AcrR family transcriptional regulator [Streptomyces sp. NPDC088116]|uniref:TetR/AcrR family transcriptional regulator n=1 Tax=Streptomyces sp. NPDC088116 TaxID=3365825 RepID=UPI003814FEF2
MDPVRKAAHTPSTAPDGGPAIPTGGGTSGTGCGATRTGTESPRTGGASAPTVPDRRALRRERLLATATELFTARGYPATSIERICASAHVSIRAFYEEFESREALLIALHNEVARAGMEATLTVLSDPATESATTRERITSLAHAFLDAVTTDASATRIAFVEIVGAGRPVEEHRLLWRSLWTDFLTGEAERAVERGEAAPRDYTLAMVALIGAVNELIAHWARNSTTLTRDRLADELTRHALATLGIAVDSVPADHTFVDSAPVDGVSTGGIAASDALTD